MKALSQEDYCLIATLNKEIPDVFYYMIPVAKRIVLTKYGFSLESVLNNESH